MDTGRAAPRARGGNRAGGATAGAAPARPAVFLDRDGVLNENLDGTYVNSWAAFHFLPGAVEAVGALTRAGYPVVIVTNQAGISRGYMTEDDLAEIHARMLAALAAGGGRVEAVLHCPHAPLDLCACRKPQPGLLRQAAADLGLDLSRSVFIGDHITDLEAALAAGCRPVLVLTGRGRAARDLIAADPRFAAVTVADDLAAAVRLLLASPGGGS